jgi:hypothetical protein
MTMPKEWRPPNTEATYRQYDRLSIDWRMHHNLIWQIPSVAVAIMVGILTVSYNFLNDIPRVILLGVGSAVILALAVALAKHRLGADARTQFLQELETKIFRIERFPLKTEDIETYLGDGLTKNRLFRLLIKRSSEIGLLYVMFGMFLTLSGLTALELLRLLLHICIVHIKMQA